jgi:2-polyprenyl-3-methyl-5-hydroxy-6-metoxy-1,4-benzoquinol methylase
MLEQFIKKEFLPQLENHSVYSFLGSSDFKKKLTEYLISWEFIRKKEKNYTHIPFSEYRDLPDALSVKKDFEWHWRKYSLKVLEKEILTAKKLLVLEIGGWNGWLSNRIAGSGNTLVTCDFFADDVDGLLSKKHYKNEWMSVQCDTENLSFFEPVFDVVILNHALSFFPNPADYCHHLKTLLKPGGKIILLGLNFYESVEKKQKEVAAFEHYYQSKYGFKVNFKNAKGYLDFTDRSNLIQLGFELKQQAGMELRNLYSKINTAKPWYAYGIFKS